MVRDGRLYPSLLSKEERQEQIRKGHTKSFQRSVEIEEGNLIAKRTGKPAMGKPHITWYVACMDEILAELRTKDEAIERCKNICMDGRKYPAMQRLNFGFYEYTAPREYVGSTPTLWIGTKENLLANGFDAQLDEWQREAVMPD